MKKQQTTLNVRLRHMLPSLVCVVVSVVLLFFAPTAAQGIRDGLLLCAQVMIPTLFPFLVLSSLLAGLGTNSGESKLLRWLMWTLLRQPPAAAGMILLSFLGGFPTGAQAIVLGMERGSLRPAQAQRLLLFCVNAGPAYLIGAVGSSLLGSRRAGLVAFLSLLAAGLVIGILTRFLSDSDAQSPEKNNSKPEKQQPTLPSLPFDKLLLQSLTQAIAAMLQICAWVVLFSCICALLVLLPENFRSASAALSCLLEVTSGCVRAVRLGVPLPVICAVVAWSGLCVHCQILGNIRKTGLRMSWFWAARAMHAALAAAICAQLLRWFPLESVSATALAGSGSGIRLWEISAPAAAALLFFCGFLVYDLDLHRKICYNIRRRGDDSTS
ncbi:MAG: hypothetical protein LBJ11_04475 [Oscillospiraceae bacterium]|jgi:sporulation integral membrane protein YlbJ|nr:hypothetical protein [Oscillospiraceae bacterium]